jgi:hypothetical protein
MTLTFDHNDECLYFISIVTNIQSLGRKRYVYANIYLIRSVTRFRPESHSIQSDINNTPQIVGVNLALFTDDTCLYTTERK